MRIHRMNSPWNAEKPNQAKAFLKAMRRAEMQYLEIFKDEIDKLATPHNITQLSFENETTVIETSKAAFENLIILISNFSEFEIL
jgi:hypothetical protein